MGHGELANVIVTVVASTSAAAFAFMAFGLFRRRATVAWETDGYGPTGGFDTQIADPDIARRIAELIPPAGFDDVDAPDPTEAPDEASPGDITPLNEQLLSDGSDESADGPGWDPASAPAAWPDVVVASPADRPAAPDEDTSAASATPDVWPATDPGVARAPFDAAIASGRVPGGDRDALSRLLTDPATGLGSAVAWELWVAQEEPRERRYRRPTTIVLAELDGLDAVVAVHGTGVADRAAAMIGATLRANVRTSDRAAVIGPGLYAVLLTETDEVRAVNFVERVRATSEEWLATNAPGVGIAFGWASPEEDGLAGARARAHQRLARDHR